MFGLQGLFFSENVRFLLHIATIYPKWRNLFAKIPASQRQSINHKLFETKCFWLSTSFGHRKSVEGRKKGISENKQNSLPRKTRMGTSIGIYNGAKRTISPKSLAHLVILCFERRCWKQNTVARLIKVKRFARRKFVGWLRR